MKVLPNKGYTDKNFPEQIYLVMVNRTSHKMDIAGFISLVVALTKLYLIIHIKLRLNFAVTNEFLFYSVDMRTCSVFNADRAVAFQCVLLLG